MVTLSKNPISRKSRTKLLLPSRAGLNSPPQNLLLFLAYFLIALFMLGCDKKTQADITGELAASFEGSQVKEDIIKANTAFSEGRYKESLEFLHKAVGSAPLTERQKKAMAAILGQILKAVHENPQLSKDQYLHRMMEMLVRRTMGDT